MTKPLIGGHVSAAGGLVNAIGNAQAIGANTFQIFGASPRQWYAAPPSAAGVSEFKKAYTAAKLGPVFLHAPYLINVASPNSSLRLKSIKLLATHLRIAEAIVAKGIVFHLGSGGEDMPSVKAENLVVLAVKEILSKVSGQSALILENSAGGGARVGSSLEQLGRLLKNLPAKRVGLCFDTAHAFEAGVISGYTPVAVKNLSQEIGKTIGWPRVMAIHSNDSKTLANSHHDRHENIGEGEIGLTGFRALAQEPHFRQIPWLLEVPGFKGEGPDARNIKILQSLFR